MKRKWYLVCNQQIKIIIKKCSQIVCDSSWPPLTIEVLLLCIHLWIRSRNEFPEFMDFSTWFNMWNHKSEINPNTWFRHCIDCIIFVKIFDKNVFGCHLRNLQLRQLVNKVPLTPRRLASPAAVHVSVCSAWACIARVFGTSGLTVLVCYFVIFAQVSWAWAFADFFFWLELS